MSDRKNYWYVAHGFVENINLLKSFYYNQGCKIYLILNPRVDQEKYKLSLMSTFIYLFYD